MMGIINTSLLKIDKDVWHFLSPTILLSKTNCKGLLIYRKPGFCVGVIILKLIKVEL